jgi:hypothetical protein
MPLGERPRFPIHDLHIRPLVLGGQDGVTRLRVLGHSDHLLRRFGVVEVLRLPAGRTYGPCLQPVADEVWVLEEGEALLFWRDERAISPTSGAEHRLLAYPPHLWLVPFGVAFAARASSPCVLLRLSTHEAGMETAALELPWPEDW